MKKRWLTIGIFVSLIILLADCAPKSEPASPPVPTVPPVTPASPIPAASVISPEETAWAKVVAAAKKEGKVNAYSFNMTGDVGLVVSKSFEQKYGIKVDIITGGGSALVQRITTEKRMGTIVADIMDANTFQISNIKIAEATTSSEEIPVLKERQVWKVEPWANDPQRHALMHTITYYPNIINTDLVKPQDEPKSIKELIQPKWKGRITVFDPRQNSGLSNVFPVFLGRKLIDMETIQRLGANDIKFYPTYEESARNMVQGKHALQLLSSTGTMGTMIMKAGGSLPVKAVDSEEGVFTGNLAIGAVRDGPHPNAAKVFINWLLSQDGQNVFIKALGAVSVRNDVPDFTPRELRLRPAKLIVPTPEEEKESTRLFRESWLAKLWGL